MKTIEEKTIGQLVADDYRTASVFESFGIDFCCKGNKTIDEVCKNKDINKLQLLQNLESIIRVEKNTTLNYNAWPLDLLADYIEKKHHRYVENKTVQLKQYLEKICTVHGRQHPELFQIKELFLESATDLAAHMKREELVLFPFIRKMAIAYNEKLPFTPPHFGTIKNPIEMMKHDHDNEGKRFRMIDELSNDYTPPEDACNTYKVTFAVLKEFKNDLHLHIHLENNILFPKSIELENKMRTQV